MRPSFLAHITMRQFLDRLYVATGWIAAILMSLIAVVVVLQIVGRLTGLLLFPAHHIAGFLFVSSLFLGLAYTLACDDHIRVSIVIEHVGPRGRRALELWCLAVGSCLASYFAVFSGRLAWDSYVFGDRSDGLIAIPYVIPQGVMTVGLVVLLIRLLDEFVEVIRTGSPRRLKPGASLEHERQSTSDKSERI